MDDVERDAQNAGYQDGLKGWRCLPSKHNYTGHLKTAYERGHRLGKFDNHKRTDTSYPPRVRTTRPTSTGLPREDER
jgi:hypothetical protein